MSYFRRQNIWQKNQHSLDMIDLSARKGEALYNVYAWNGKCNEQTNAHVALSARTEIPQGLRLLRVASSGTWNMRFGRNCHSEKKIYKYILINNFDNECFATCLHFRVSPTMTMRRGPRDVSCWKRSRGGDFFIRGSLWSDLFHIGWELIHHLASSWCICKLHGPDK